MIYLGYLLLVGFFVGLDQYSKQLIVTFIKEREKLEIIPGFFDITYVKNTGAAWSLLEGSQSMFILITIGAIIFFLVDFIKGQKKNWVFKLSCLMILGGAIGNLIDRLINNYVVDFLDFYIFGYDFPVFNVADCFLTVGVTLYLIYSIWEMKHAKN